jgi:hypothetical protein
MPLHTTLLRPRVQQLVCQYFMFTIIKACGVELNGICFTSIISVANIVLQIQEKPVAIDHDAIMPLACIMMNWCIYAYYHLRCKYENVRDSYLVYEKVNAVRESLQ